MTRFQPQSTSPAPAPAPLPLRPPASSGVALAYQAQAQAAAEAAAQAGRAARVTLRELSEPAEHAGVEALFAEIWATGPGQTPMPAGVMRMLAYTGSYVAGAFDGDRLVGGGVAFLTGSHGEAELDGGLSSRLVSLHSHIVGVAADLAGRHAGLAIKLHQRAWALQRGLGTISWTYDPLVRRNAYFNLTKLGADATRYLVDFYGDMSDGVNVGQGSDRLFVDWDLGSQRCAAAIAGFLSVPDIEPLLRTGRVLIAADDGRSPAAAKVSGRGPLLCGLPADIELMRKTDPARALQWRLAVRDALGGAMARGFRIVGFARAGYYLLEHPEEAEYK